VKCKLFREHGSPRELGKWLHMTNISRAIVETAEQINAGLAVPTDKRIVIEDWEDFVIIHANFGSLVNRALAQLLGEMLSEKLGHGIVVQHDSYRIFLQTMGSTNVNGILQVFDELCAMTEQTVKNTLIKSAVKTGLFKRRIIHVAHRFGALKKWADFSSMSLQKLIMSFEGTPIYDESLKEVFTKDLDSDGVIQVIGSIKNGEIKLQALETDDKATPIARIGIERVSMKTDLIPPERLRAVLVESAKARLLNETANFVCTNCWDYLEMIRVKDLPDKPKCPRCGSLTLGFLKVDEERVLPLIEKKGQKLAQVEEKLQTQAVKTSQLIAKYGKAAAVALSGRRVRVLDVAGVLQVSEKLSDNFYELVLEAERKAMSKLFR